MDTDNTSDRLESLWLRLGAKIKDREEELKRLKERFQKLNDARAVILEAEAELLGDDDLRVFGRTLPAGQTDEVSPTLKQATVEYMKEAAGYEGKSASEVTAALVERGLGAHVAPRTFYSMVYLTLMRLADGGELRVKKGPRGRLFAPLLGRNPP